MSKKRTSQKQSRLKREVVRFAEYMFTGGAWFWSGYVLIVVLDDHIGLFAANFIGNAVGITLNFILERFWVFKTKQPAKLALTASRYIIYTALNAFLLNYFILYGLEQYANIKPEIGQFISSGFFTVWNYFWYKTWVFAKSGKKPEPRRATKPALHHPRHLRPVRAHHGG